MLSLVLEIKLITENIHLIILFFARKPILSKFALYESSNFLLLIYIKILFKQTKNKV